MINFVCVVLCVLFSGTRSDLLSQISTWKLAVFSAQGTERHDPLIPDLGGFLEKYESHAPWYTISELNIGPNPDQKRHLLMGETQWMTFSHCQEHPGFRESV